MDRFKLWFFIRNSYNDRRLHQPKTTVADVAGGRARGGRGGKETSLFSATRTITMRLVSSRQLEAAARVNLAIKRPPFQLPKLWLLFPSHCVKVVPLNYCLSPASNAIGWMDRVAYWH